MFYSTTNSVETKNGKFNNKSFKLMACSEISHFWEKKKYDIICPSNFFNFFFYSYQARTYGVPEALASPRPTPLRQSLPLRGP